MDAKTLMGEMLKVAEKNKGGTLAESGISKRSDRPLSLAGVATPDEMEYPAFSREICKLPEVQKQREFKAKTSFRPQL